MERELIGSLELSQTFGSGKPVVELYSTDTRLKFPALRLFDLSALVAAGIDPDSLETGKRVHARLWAYYTVSGKKNKDGHPYKDVSYLEAIDRPATATSADNTALLAELRAIRALLEALADAQGLHTPDADAGNELEDAFPRYADGNPVSDNQAELDAYRQYIAVIGQPPESIETLRGWVRSRQ